MTKRVYLTPRVKLGGIDVSHLLMSWRIGAKVGELYVAEIELVHCDMVEIVRDARHIAGDGTRISEHDMILIAGIDISRWISGYDIMVRAGEKEYVRLYVQCDRDVLSINGVYPWEEAPSND